MSKEQIEEMVFIIQENSPLSKISSEDVAESLYNAGYRKQNVGEWIKHGWAEEENGFLIPNYECTNCHDWKREKTDFCPNCGAKMKGGE